MQLCQPLILIFQFFKIFEQRTSTPLKFESWFRPCITYLVTGLDGTCLACDGFLHPISTMEEELLKKKRKKGKIFFFKRKNTNNN